MFGQSFEFLEIPTLIFDFLFGDLILDFLGFVDLLNTFGTLGLGLKFLESLVLLEFFKSVFALLVVSRVLSDILVP
jgi:hypothetical protein